MSVVAAALLGIVQGLTEFLPVSSSAHLILARAFFGWDAGALGLPFDLACHLGTLLAVIVFSDQFMSFIWPLVATQDDELQVLTTGVASFRARGGVDYGLWSAAAVMSLIPIAIFFVALQRQFLARNLAGALKQ